MLSRMSGHVFQINLKQNFTLVDLFEFKLMNLWVNVLSYSVLELTAVENAAVIKQTSSRYIL